MTLNLDKTWLYDIVDALLKERNIYHENSVREGTIVAGMERRLELLGMVSLSFNKSSCSENKNLW